jgi:hypothetical protein
VSRVRENRTHGSMGGRWKRSGTTHGDGLSPQWGNPGTMAAGPTDRRRHRASALPDRHRTSAAPVSLAQTDDPLRRAYPTRSNTAAMPIPPPMQSVTSP